MFICYCIIECAVVQNLLEFNMLKVYRDYCVIGSIICTADNFVTEDGNECVKSACIMRLRVLILEVNLKELGMW